MKILKYIKLKNNKYRVDFETESLDIYDDLIIKYELLLKKNLKEEEFKRLKEENITLEGYYFALKYLSVKERTKKEVEDYLKKKDITSASIKLAIQKLESMGYLNEARYVTFFLNDSLKFSKDGPNKIRQKLKDLGISESSIEQELSKIADSIWKEKMQKLIDKRITMNHSYSEILFKNKLSAYLYSNGYPREWIVSFLENLEFQKDENIIKKEKEKLERKLSRKWSGEQLKMQIRLKLYQKGFSKEEIEKIMS